ncbi:tyrosine-type recombinase/integrase [Alteribacillus sp. HJP-4]|uniref:tyrosine-type recombinase/integrase n=1 Tax=Alteribacillus sp. HJP-4 TaxID=2775394 RepID=UPI0035CD071A
MEYVQPIKDHKTICLLKRTLKKQSYRDYLLFVFAINTGMRISELLHVQWEEVLEKDGTISLFLPAEKESIYLNERIRRTLIKYKKSHQSGESPYLFPSLRSGTPITRQQAYRIMNNAAKKVGIVEKIGPHTLRKTFGYHAYIQGIAIALIQKRFHHSTPSETLKYIGVIPGEIQSKINVNL